MRPPSIPYFVAQRACTPFSSNGRITFANVAIGRTVDAGGVARRAFRRRDHGVASFLADAFPDRSFSTILFKVCHADRYGAIDVEAGLWSLDALQKERCRNSPQFSAKSSRANFSTADATTLPR